MVITDRSPQGHTKGPARTPLNNELKSKLIPSNDRLYRPLHFHKRISKGVPKSWREEDKSSRVATLNQKDRLLKKVAKMPQEAPSPSK